MISKYDVFQVSTNNFFFRNSLVFNEGKFMDGYLVMVFGEDNMYKLLMEHGIEHVEYLSHNEMFNRFQRWYT